MENPVQKRWLRQPGGIVERLLQLQGNTKNVDFALRAGMRPSKLSKLRRAQQMPTEQDIRDWVEAAGAGREVEGELLEILAHGTATGFAQSLRQGQATHQRTYNELVEQADVVRMLERSFVPSMMQTRDYATAVLAASMRLHQTADDVAEAVEARLERRKYLLDLEREFELVLDEAVLTRRVAPATVMFSQLDRILEDMDRKNVRLGILPINGEFHDVVRNSFEMYGEVGVIEDYYNDEEMDHDSWVVHLAAMNEIWQDAVEGDAAKALIRAAMDQHSRTMKRPPQRKAR